MFWGRRPIICPDFEMLHALGSVTVRRDFSSIASNSLDSITTILFIWMVRALFETIKMKTWYMFLKYNKLGSCS